MFRFGKKKKEAAEVISAASTDMSENEGQQDCGGKMIDEEDN